MPDTAPVLYPTVVLQMDQAEPAHQGLLWHQRECRQNPDMDRCHRLLVDCHPEETAQNRGQSLHNSTDFKRDRVRENAYKTATYGFGLQ